MLQPNIPLILKNGSIKLSQNLEPSDEVVCDETFNTIVSVSKTDKKSYIVKPVNGDEFTIPFDGCIAVLPKPPTVASEGDLFILNWWKETGKTTRCFNSLTELGIKRSQIEHRPILEIPIKQYLSFTKEERKNYYITSKPMRMVYDPVTKPPLLFHGYLVGLLLSAGKLSPGGKIYLSKRIKSSVIARINATIFDLGQFTWVKKKDRYDLVPKAESFFSGIKSMLMNKEKNFVIHSTMIQQDIKQHYNLLAGIIEGQKELKEKDGMISFDAKEFINIQILKCICSFYGMSIFIEGTVCTLDKRYTSILPLSTNNFDTSKFKYDNRIGTVGEMYQTDVEFKVSTGKTRPFVDVSLANKNTKLRTIEGRFVSCK